MKFPKTKSSCCRFFFGWLAGRLIAWLVGWILIRGLATSWWSPKEKQGNSTPRKSMIVTGIELGEMNQFAQ